MTEKKTNKSSGKKRRERKKESQEEAYKVDLDSIGAYKPDEADSEKKKKKLQRKKKRNNDMTDEVKTSKAGELHNEVKGSSDEPNDAHADIENEESKLRKKRRKNKNTKEARVDKVDEQHELCNEVDDGSKKENGKSKKSHKTKEKDSLLSRKEVKLPEKNKEAEQSEVYEISSGDEDSTKGMKKWITEYHQNRPGLKILQERIDDFITTYEEQEEQARKEREALAAEGGWTVVVHHKGRKKTTDGESGITVGSVAQAAVLENIAKKKSKDVGLDFYRFQKREAKRNEIMMLQSKFEEDKKRIQQMRAARKFRPY